jgi:hypothetical protein
MQSLNENGPIDRWPIRGKSRSIFDVCGVVVLDQPSYGNAEAVTTLSRMFFSL